MSFNRKNLLLSTALPLSAAVAYGQTSNFEFSFVANSVGNYRQTVDETRFEGGTFGITVRDGNFTWAGQPCEWIRFFSGTGRCAPGSTGFVSRGLENDPLLRGLGPYFTITSISPALILDPFNPQAARLVAAPPSLLPRPLIGFEDLSISIFYDLYTNFITQYRITRYDFQRQYGAGERAIFDGEVVPGTYRYNFPSIIDPIRPVVLEVNQFPMLDGFRKVNNQPRGIRFLNVTYDDGFAVIDPFALNTLTWEGNTFSFVSAANDESYLSIKRLADPTDPLSDPLIYNGLGPFVNGAPNPTVPIFPPIAGTIAVVPRVLLPSPLDTTYIIPPGFLGVGQTGVLDLEFIINRPTTNLITERATRRFRMPVRVLNPFDGVIFAALPPGTSAEQRSADFDFDGDGVSNFNEWVFGSDPASEFSVPTAPTVTIHGGALGSDSDPALKTIVDNDGLEYKVAKLINPVPELKYSIEYSPDMVKWTEITSDNPDWNLVETHDEIKVTETGDGRKSRGFFRTKVRKAD